MSKLIVAQSLSCNIEKEVTPYTVACTMFAGRLVRDRFNNLNQYSEMNWVDTVDPVPEPKDTPMKELMDQRAQDFLGKQVVVQWSGGVDSTAVLLALIKNGVQKEDLQIFYSQGSVAEYPKLYEYLLQNKFNLFEVSDWRQDLGSVTTDVITNGWCADQLYGSLFFHEGYRQYHWSIEKLLTTTEAPYGKLTEEQAKEFTQIYKDAAKKTLGLDLVIAAHLGWFVNFCMKWTWVSTYNELFLLGTKNGRKTRCFFDTDYFQSWAVNNFSKMSEHNIYGKKTQYYKRDLKEYCNEVFPDSEFLETKTKNPSWNGTVDDGPMKEYRVTLKLDDGYRVYSLPLHSKAVIDYPFNRKFFTRYMK